MIYAIAVGQPQLILASPFFESVKLSCNIGSLRANNRDVVLVDCLPHRMCVASDKNVIFAAAYNLHLETPM